jgi:serralysin
MVRYIVSDGTGDANISRITADHFGVNVVTIYDEEFGDNEGNLSQLVEEMGITTLRFPGGSATEHFFDMNNPNLDVSPYDPSQTLLPMDAFFQQAGESGLAATIVIPTKQSFQSSAAQAMIEGDYGSRSTLDPDYLQNVVDYIVHTMAVAVENGVDIAAFEIGNEFWGAGQMTASEYGALVATLAPLISETLSQIGDSSPELLAQTTSSASRLFSPATDIVAYASESSEIVYTQQDIDQDFGGVAPAGYVEVGVPGQGTAYWQVYNLVQQINGADQASTAIDGVINHHYVRGGLSTVDDSFEFGFDQMSRFANLLDRPNDLPDLSYHITEWNANATNAVDNRGSQHASMMIEMLYEQVTHGVDSAQIWPLTFDNSQSITLTDIEQENLTLAGEMFSLMSESLIGLDPVCDWSVDGNLDVHGFSGDNRHVFFVSERSGEVRENIELDLDSFLDNVNYTVSIVELSDGGAGGQNQRAEAQVSVSDPFTIEGSLVSFSLSSWSNVRIELVEAPQRGLGGAGNDVIRGSHEDDSLSGGGGRDTIVGERGADTIAGGGQGDRVLGGTDDDRILGNGGHDRLNGGRGEDTIWGGAGNDVLVGKSGDDVVFDGRGSDSLIGGPGDDTFIFAVDNKLDIIADFDVEHDLINVTRFGLSNVDELTLTEVRGWQGPGSTNVQISFGSEVTVLERASLEDFQGVNLEDIFLV